MDRRGAGGPGEAEARADRRRLAAAALLGILDRGRKRRPDFTCRPASIED
jgi:hypothetical protein